MTKHLSEVVEAYRLISHLAHVSAEWLEGGFLGLPVPGCHLLDAAVQIRYGREGRDAHLEELREPGPLDGVGVLAQFGPRPAVSPAGDGLGVLHLHSSVGAEAASFFNVTSGGPASLLGRILSSLSKKEKSAYDNVLLGPPVPGQI